VEWSEQSYSPPLKHGGAVEDDHTRSDSRAQRSDGGAARDRATRVLIVVTLAAAITLGELTASQADTPRVPGPYRPAGSIVMWLGLALRILAIAALGRAFRTTVEVDPGQAVVTTGPYRWVRHPSYSGLLLIVIGFGLATGYRLALACAALRCPRCCGASRRGSRADRRLGDRYRSYEDRTKRLIPGVW
jgi:protein-S-isoprenylcysteine O-methyltransferase Ste14